MTISDLTGQERVAALEKCCTEIQLQILHRQLTVATMQQEAEHFRKEAEEARFIAGLMEKHGRY